MAGARKKFTSYSDLSLMDYANNPNIRTGTKRARKGLTSSVINTAKIVGCEEIAELRISITEEDENETEEKDENSDQVAKPIQLSRSKSKIKLKVKNGLYKDYPFDVWMAVGQYIKAEDVRSFALTCKTTYAVSQSVMFWKSLQKRYIPAPSKASNLLLERFHILQELCTHYKKLSYKPECQLSSWSNKNKCNFCFLEHKIEAHGKYGNKVYETFIKLRKGLSMPKLLKLRQFYQNVYLLKEAIYHCYLKIKTKELPPPLDHLQKKRFLYAHQRSIEGDLLLWFSFHDASAVTFQEKPLSFSLRFGGVISADILHYWHPEYPYDSLISQIKELELSRVKEVPDSWEELAC